MWPFGQTWTFTRPGTEDRTGDRAAGAPFTVAGCVFWPDAETAEDFARNTITAHGTLAVPESADVRQTDRPQSPTDEKFTIVGLARWSGPHALTGWRPGYKLFRVKGVT